MTDAPHWETQCPKRSDGQHCSCWYDGEECCSCGDNPKESNVETDLTFSTALVLLKEGKRLQRVGWNGKGLHIALQVPDEHSKMTAPYLYISTVSGGFVPWAPSQTDVLAEDWLTVDG